MHPLIPLLIIVIILLVGAVVGFVIYSVVNDIAAKTSKKMEDNNVAFGKDGLKIGVKEMRNEDYVGHTQDVLVKAWNLSTWPAYKSRFWNKDGGASGGGASGSSSGSRAKSGSGSAASAGARRPSSHRSPSASGQSGSKSHSSGHRTENGRLAEPRPSIRRTASGSSIPGAFD